MSVTDAKQALFDLFALNADDNPSEPVDALTEVTAVYRGEARAGNTATPIALSIFPTGGDATELTFNLILLAKPDRDVMDVQSQFDLTVDQVNEILAANEQFGRESWSCSYDASIDALVCIWQMNCGRTDF